MHRIRDSHVMPKENRRFSVLIRRERWRPQTRLLLCAGQICQRRVLSPTHSIVLIA